MVRLIVFGVEQSEVPADHFVREVAFYFLGSCIPAADKAVRIKLVDRIVGDVLDEKGELAFAPPDGIFGFPALGQVTCDFCETD